MFHTRHFIPDASVKSLLGIPQLLSKVDSTPEKTVGTIAAVRGRKPFPRAGIGAECALASLPPNRCLSGYYQQYGLLCEGPAAMTETRE